MGITSESQIIDIGTIEQGCTQLTETASQFKTHAETLRKIASQIGRDVLSADNQKVDDEIIAIADEVEALEGFVSRIAGVIRANARSIHSEDIQRYNEQLEENS